ncbi:hypothetical protein ASE14_13215 [Agromyces sp. Root81]|uniref:hypothetical protein n=1 Tax=Agromyces sp. Root81 TaxID=1736601 RepID=UPI0006FC9CF1|nr:hypothetical protein [Agromyces sp. Root81]KRC61772.1 hypothetical protein ASE14_13215 [Agromyces sp. Root81]
MADTDDGSETESARAAEVAEHVARLQRIAFGGAASAAEQHDAAVELEELRRTEADAAAASAARAALEHHGHAGHPPDGLPDDEASSTAFEPLAPSRETDARGIRWAIVAGAVALALGLGIGWQLGGRSVAPFAEPTPTPTASPAPGAPMPTPTGPATVALDETSMPDVLARPPAETDALDAAFMQSYSLVAGSARRLVSRPDGLVVYAANRESEVCVIASYSAGSSDGGVTCSTSRTVDGDGLSTIVMGNAIATTVRWRTDGAVELIPVPPVMPADAEPEEAE